MRELPQVRIIHLSDIHFGASHICCPQDPSGSSEGIPLLEHLIEQDLSDAFWADSLWATSKKDRPSTPLFVAVTGDLTQGAEPGEFQRAHAFFKYLAESPLLDSVIPLKHLFVVPGNHDVRFGEKLAETRFQAYCTFYNKLFSGIRPFVQPHEAPNLTQLHCQREEKLLVAEINSCLYVEKDTKDESRGQIDLAAIAKLRRELGDLQDETKGFIKVALFHHHPILLPSLVEPGRGYDALVNAGSLLRLLKENGFHLILHGHKHYPQVFTFDPESAWSSEENIPQLIVVGGSCGSCGLPAGTKSGNTYNVITVKWDPDAMHARVQVITRGLVRTSDDGQLDPDEWKWATLRVFDRTLGPYNTVPIPHVGLLLERPTRSDDDEERRSDHYQSLRFNMPVAEVTPSLLPGQAYEVRVWLEPHKKRHKEFPIKVTWSGGPLFRRQVYDSTAAPNFCSYFHYWDSMLVQAELEFADGGKAYGHVYARFPEAK
jgi:3',5'-cyclic AMP phosphodiesterase CpdA